MSVLQENALENLREARVELLKTKKQNLTYEVLRDWVAKQEGPILAAGEIAGSQGAAITPLRQAMTGYESETKLDVLEAVRDRMVESIDATIAAVGGKQVVRPVLDELILRVKDTKLATLLNEFNACKDGQPNLAAIGFRTILCALIVEIAKGRHSASKLAKSDDFSLDPIIDAALEMKLFDDGERRLIERFRTGPKVRLDIVAHKPGEKSLIAKDDLSSAVDNILNQLLKAL